MRAKSLAVLVLALTFLILPISCEKSIRKVNNKNTDMKSVNLTNITPPAAKPPLAAGWISVNEKLPEHENNVLAVLDGQVCIMRYFSFQENGEVKMVWGYVYDGINGDGIFDDNYYPTHWMDIPCPPACS
jgi:hypothetical protein